MKVCNDCNVEMIEDCKIEGQHPFEIGVDGKSRIYLTYTDGTREVKGIFGKTLEIDNVIKANLKGRVCPKCGKVEMYVDLENIDANY